jgi:hypothetical protein
MSRSLAQQAKLLLPPLCDVLHADKPPQIIQRTITKFGIQNTLPRLQHDFCTSWNELVREGWINSGIPYCYLRPMRHLYIALHRGTSAAPTAFPSSTDDYDRISSYPLYNIPGHHPTYISHSLARQARSLIPLPPPLHTRSRLLTPFRTAWPLMLGLMCLLCPCRA